MLQMISKKRCFSVRKDNWDTMHFNSLQGRCTRGEQAAHGPEFFGSRQIFENFYASSAKFLTLLLAMIKVSNLIGKSVSLPPPIYRCHDALHSVQHHKCDCAKEKFKKVGNELMQEKCLYIEGKLVAYKRKDKKFQIYLKEL